MPRKALEPILTKEQRTAMLQAAMSQDFDLIHKFEAPKFMGLAEFAETSGLHYSTIRNYAANRLLGAKIAGIFYVDWRTGLIDIYSGHLAEKAQDQRKSHQLS